MSTVEEIRAGIELERARRKRSEQEIEASRPLIVEATSLWQRIKVRRQQNGFGEDFEIALTRRG